MSARVEAVRNALDMTGAEMTWDMIEAALAAADAVMFSDENLERLWSALMAVDYRNEMATSQLIHLVVKTLKGAGQ